MATYFDGEKIDSIARENSQVIVGASGTLITAPSGFYDAVFLQKVDVSGGGSINLSINGGLIESIASGSGISNDNNFKIYWLDEGQSITFSGGGGGTTVTYSLMSRRFVRPN